MSDEIDWERVRHAGSPVETLESRITSQIREYDRQRREQEAGSDGSCSTVCDAVMSAIDDAGDWTDDQFNDLTAAVHGTLHKHGLAPGPDGGPFDTPDKPEHDADDGAWAVVETEEPDAAPAVKLWQARAPTCPKGATVADRIEDLAPDHRLAGLIREQMGHLVAHWKYRRRWSCHHEFATDWRGEIRDCIATIRALREALAWEIVQWCWPDDELWVGTWAANPRWARWQVRVEDRQALAPTRLAALERLLGVR